MPRSADHAAPLAPPARRSAGGRRAAILVARVVCGGLALAAWTGWIGWALGQVFTDTRAWSQWLHWIPTPLAIGGAAIGLVAVWPVVRRRPAATVVRAAAVAALLATVARFGLVQHRLLVPAAVAPPGLRVMHWTIGLGSRVDWDAIADTIIERDPDLAILTDASRVVNVPAFRTWMQERGMQRRRLGSFTILTRRPMRSIRVLARDPAILIVALELDAPEMPDGRLMLHLVNMPSDPERSRREVVDTAITLMAESAEDRRGAAPDAAVIPPPDLVIGDFNMARGSGSMARLVPGLRHAYDEAGHGYAATFHEDWPLWHIDHTWLGPRVRCTRYDTPFESAWRHYPQIAWIAPAAPAAPVAVAEPGGS